MNDLLFIGITVLFFSLSIGLISALDGLREDKP
jgi:hypothetical protein